MSVYALEKKVVRANRFIHDPLKVEIFMKIRVFSKDAREPSYCV